MRPPVAAPVKALAPAPLPASTPISRPAAACQATLGRNVKSQDTITVTGNVLRDYLTDLFPTRIVFIRFIGTHADYDKIDATQI